MDANQGTVSSIAELLIVDEVDGTLEVNDVSDRTPPSSTPASRTPPASPSASNVSSGPTVGSTNGGPVGKRKLSFAEPESTALAENDSELNDSVFGDIALDDRPVRFHLQRSISQGSGGGVDTDEDREDGDCSSVSGSIRSTFQRHGSLRSQISTTSSVKEPVKREIKLKTFVSLLFVFMVTGVAVVLSLARAQDYRVELSRNILVHEDTRRFHLRNANIHDVLTGQLGQQLPPGLLPFDCSKDVDREKHLCLRWHKRAHLDIWSWQEGAAKCYDIGWRSLAGQPPPTDCFDLQLSSVRWYGGWVRPTSQTWPTAANLSVPMAHYVTSSGDPRLAEPSEAAFGPVLERYWLSSNGVAIFMSNKSSPLQVSWNAPSGDGEGGSPDGRLCLRADPQYPSYRLAVQDDTSSRYLNYSMCVGRSLVDVHRLALKHISKRRNSTPSSQVPDLSVFDSPVWSARGGLGGANLSQAALVNLTDRIANTSLPVGSLLLEDGWQRHRGDLVFNKHTFPEPLRLVRQLREQLNCSLVVEVDPFFSIHSDNFLQLVARDFLVRDAGGKAPGLFHLRKNASDVVGAVDAVSEDASRWFKSTIETLKQSSGVEYLSFTGGASTLLPYGATVQGDVVNTDQYTRQYGLLAESLSTPAIVSSVTHLQGRALIVHVNVPSLETLLPSVLTLGLLGYPFALATVDFTHSPPSEDLYRRSIQLSAFLPVMHFAIPPDTYGPATVDVARRMVALHRTLVVPRVANLSAALTHPADPIIRPLWWQAPGDPVAQRSDSQFLVGDDLLVAPVLEEGTTEREVYFPAGEWYDAHHKKHSGPNWETIAVKSEDIAYFIKNV